MQHYLSDSQDSLVKKASYLRILAASLADGMKMGNFRSLYRGQGIEFSGVRDYIRGDDIRSIDWNVTARIGRPYVKVFEEERELEILLVVDSSKSMHLQDKNTSKYKKAAEAAALVTLAAELNSCPLGAVLFDGIVHFSSKPIIGREQTMVLLTHLDRLEESVVPGSVLGTALTGAGKLLSKRSLVFVFSDFRTGEWEKPLIALAHKNDVVACRIKDSYDEDLPSVGAVPFIDVESGIKMRLPSSSKSFKRQWKNFNVEQEERWLEICAKHGISTATLSTEEEPLQVLARIFAQKTKL